MQSVKEGVEFVIPTDILGILTWEEIETRCCGEKIIDIDKLKKITNYCGCDENNEFIQRFWRVLEEFSEEHKQKYLKFVWGRSRLPVDLENLNDNHEIDLIHEGDESLPEAHTCFFTLDLPRYTTDEICKQKLTLAIELCGDIDGDGGPRYDEQDEDLM